MKYIVMAASFAFALALSQLVLPVQAQGDVAQMCRSKYGLGPKEANTASEARRKESAAKVAACIRSGGKS